MLLHKDYLSERLTKRVDEFGNKDYQCVAQTKHYAKEVLGGPLGSFGGYAKSAKFGPGKTFDPKYYRQLIPGKDDLKQGDIVIQDFLSTGHVGVVHRADGRGYYLIEQNNGELDKNDPERWGNGDGLDNDAILIRHYKWSDRKILQMYRRIPN